MSCSALFYSISWVCYQVIQKIKTQRQKQPHCYDIQRCIFCNQNSNKQCNYTKCDCHGFLIAKFLVILVCADNTFKLLPHARNTSQNAQNYQSKHQNKRYAIYYWLCNIKARTALQEFYKAVQETPCSAAYWYKTIPKRNKKINL